MTRPADPYAQEAHPVSITPAANGGWVAYCAACSAREGDWVSPCRTWSPTTPVRLFETVEIAGMLRKAETELGRGRHQTAGAEASGEIR